MNFLTSRCRQQSLRESERIAGLESEWKPFGSQVLQAQTRGDVARVFWHFDGALNEVSSFFNLPAPAPEPPEPEIIFVSGENGDKWPRVHRWFG